MIDSFHANLLMRIWTGMLLLMVAMLSGSIIANASGQVDRALIVGFFVMLTFLVGVLLLLGACRLLIASVHAILWR
jgi:hypothetical protein